MPSASALPDLGVLPHLYGSAWDGNGPWRGAAIVQPQRAIGALTSRHPTDAMLVAYRVPGAPAFPRLAFGAEVTLAGVGQAPELVWALLDFDRKGHEAWGSLDEAGAVLSAMLAMNPGWGGYTTRGGLRLLRPLTTPLPVQKVAALHRDIDLFVLDGLHRDAACSDWSRLFRAPRVVRDGVPLEAKVVLEGMTPLDVDAGALPDAVSLPTASLDDVPDEPVVLSPDDLAHAADMPWALLGRPVPATAEGSAYVTARSALARIAARGRYTDPHTLASFLWASTDATEGSALGLGELWKLSSWVAKKQAETNAADATADPTAPPPRPPDNALDDDAWAIVERAFRPRLTKQANRLRDGLPVTSIASRQGAALIEATRHLVMHTSLPPDAVYNAVRGAAVAQDEDLGALWARVLELVRERETKMAAGDFETAKRRAFVTRWPLTLATEVEELYQLDTTTTPYRYRRTSPLGIEMDFNEFTVGNLQIEADYSGLSVRDILTMYGGRARTRVYVSGQTGTVYDPAEKELSVGVHNLAKCRPVEHPAVGEWLRLLGGDNPDGLLNWLAAVTFTRREPLAALYLAGPKGAGKTLLARGVACLWGAMPVDYNTVMNSGFNAEVLACPLLFADEGVVVNRYNKEAASLRFRNVVAGQGLYVNAKYQQPSLLRGALRVMVAANGDDGLPFRESLAREGIEAITQRVLYVKVSKRASAFLEQIGGRSGVKGWAPGDCTPGKIAEHLLWLRSTRKITKRQGRRFLVEGKETPWHRIYGVRQGIKPGVLQVLFQLLQRQRRNTTGPSTLLRDDQKDMVIWATSSTVISNWDQFARTYPARPGQIQDALRQLATGSKKMRFPGGSRRAVRTGWSVPYSAFIDAGVCEIEDLASTDADVVSQEGQP